MKTPPSLETLVEYGIISEVLRPLMSGKEAQVYLVVSAGQVCVAKVYKEAERRTFKHRADYTEGRRTRNSRDQRAMAKRSQHGKKRDEEAWRNQEVDMIYRLRDAGVTVPEPFNFVEGVLVMELVQDAEGQPAPRLGDLVYTPENAKEIYDQLLAEVIRMLCAGVIHGDLSDFNVLMSASGPVVIDFPQSIDPTRNANAEKLLLRDVENLHRFLSRFAPDEPIRPYGQEMWALYQANRLKPDTKLGGRYAASEKKADTREVMSLIEDAQRDAKRRDGSDESAEDEAFDGVVRAGLTVAKPFRQVVDFTKEKAPSARGNKSKEGDRPGRRRRAPKGPRSEEARNPSPSRSRSTSGSARRPPAGPAADRANPADPSDAPPSRPARRRRRSGTRDARPDSRTDARTKEGDASRGGRGAQSNPPNAGEGAEAPRARSRRRRSRRNGEVAGGSAETRGRKTDAAEPPKGPAQPRGDRSESETTKPDPKRSRRRRRPRRTSSE